MSRMPQVTMRPGPELYAQIKAMGERFDLTDAEVCRQLLVSGFVSFQEGRCKIKKCSSKISSRKCGLAISLKKKGRCQKKDGSLTMSPAPEPLPKVDGRFSR